MVNFTYDACEIYSFLSRFPPELTDPSLSAGDINWYDASTGKTVVYNLGDIAWVISATALVWIMIPGVGYFYSGLLRRKNALSMIWLSMVTLAVVSFQVILHSFISCTVDLHLPCSGSFGGQYANAAATRLLLKVRSVSSFSLAFSDTANLYIGDLRQSTPYYSRLHTY
jgi:hypothetical protein